MGNLSGASGSFIWIAVMLVMMYFLILRPQKKQQKSREAMLSSLKKGDRVVTIGGINGIVRAIKEDRVTLEIASEIYVHFTKSAIASIVRSDNKAAKGTADVEDEDFDEKDTQTDLQETEDIQDVQDVDYVVEQDKE
jgi:preprotein translocase subunit YajC